MARIASLIGLTGKGEVRAIAQGTGHEIDPLYKSDAPTWAKSVILLDTNGRTKKRKNPLFGSTPKTKGKSAK